MGLKEGGVSATRGLRGKLQNLIDVVRRLGVKRSGIKACPKCGSVNLRPSSYLDSWLTPEVYYCPSCGYRGPIVLELEEDF